MDIDQEYELVPLEGDEDRLKEHPRNPKQGNVEVIDESIGVNGWYGAVVAQKSTGYILAGNHRFRVAKQRGAKEIPVIWRDVDDDTALRILLVDNRSADLGAYDEAKLQEALESLETIDGTGYGLGAVEELERPEEGPEEASDDAEDEDVPDDVYEPQYGVMVLCDSEADQQATYEELQSKWPEKKLHVVAV